MRLQTLLPAILSGTAALLCTPVQAATFTWTNGTANWNATTSWVEPGAPTGLNPSDVLIFGGSVGQVGSATTWTATNNITNVPFLLSELRFNGTDANPLNSGLSHTITGNALRFMGEMPQILQNGSANMVINTPLSFSGNLLFDGSGDANGVGTVTINAGVSGVGNIIKSGSSTFRFGTPQVGATPVASANTWMGSLILGDGTVRFNNNAQAASAALRANPVVFVGAATLSAKRDRDDEVAGFETSLRMGTVSGATGTVLASVEGTGSQNVSNYDVVITAMSDGDFGGGFFLQAPYNAGDDGGDLIIRGVATQTFSGTLGINKDVKVGQGATLALTNNATLAAQVSGAITMAGGTAKLDNTFGNAPLTFGQNLGRLRDATKDSTTLETIGGGTLQLLGSTTATTREETGRLQLGSYSGTALESKPRSGHLKLEVVNQGNLTELLFKSYSRDQQTLNQFATVEFGARTAAGAFINLGTTSARIYLTKSTDPTPFVVPLVNGLLSTTAGTASVGWAVTNTDAGPHFATHGATGITAVTTTAWSTSLPAGTNARVTGTVDTPGTGVSYAVNSIRIAPTNVNATLNILGTDVLSSTAFLLAGGIDYAIQATGSGSIGGSGTRFFHVQSANLTVDAPLTGTAQPIVKSGEGTLSLTRNNSALNQVVALNGGALRATPGTTLPQGEIRFRGGQLEIQGGGTFSRNVNFGTNSVNWSGLALANNVVVEEGDDRGSGGFAAIGADVTIDLNTAGPTLLSWEDQGFVRSGYALTFGSKSATHQVTWTDHLSLSTADPNVYNYNAREIRVLNNPASQLDRARITGTISGRQENDLLKTGPGDLELTATNTYSGATLIHEGRLFVNGNSSASFLHKVTSGATLGGRGTVGHILVDEGGILAPGMLPNVASILNTKDVQFADSTGILRLELGGTSPGGDGTGGYDRLNVTGKVTLSDASLQGSLLNGFLAGPTDLFFVIINDGIDAVEGMFAEGNQVTFGSQTFVISYTADSVSAQFSGGNDVALQLIPEPSSVLLLGLGALAVARRRRAAR